MENTINTNKASKLPNILFAASYGKRPEHSPGGWNNESTKTFRNYALRVSTIEVIRLKIVKSLPLGSIPRLPIYT
ncbi:MAG: hypothetical protein IIA58_01725 [Candidatus Marinimicrobia bacterium]|nr:hypothetical protein [Candidatus Neomarinimicrobiota bacterium]